MQYQSMLIVTNNSQNLFKVGLTSPLIHVIITVDITFINLTDIY